MTSDVPPADAATAGPRRGGSWAAAIVGLLAVAAAIAGGVLLSRAGEGGVALIRVTKHSMIPESLVGVPDYYLSIVLRDAKEDEEPIVTETYSDTPIGNGLDFNLAKPLDLKRFATIELMDEDVASDDIRDRVDVRERVCRGQDYQFELIGAEDPRREWGYWALGGGGGALVLAAILWARAHAV